MHLTIGPHEGSYPAWWKEIRVEIYGQSPKQRELFVNAKRIANGVEVNPNGADFLIADDGNGAEIELR
jgi:hypothetical protein